MMPHFSKASQDKLDTCHPDLQRLMNEVIKERDCTIVCGYRDKAGQDVAYQDGAGLAWPRSKHNRVPSEAVDVMPCPIDWHDLEGVYEFANLVLITAKLLDINIKWGGTFKKFDGPHYELIDNA